MTLHSSPHEDAGITQGLTAALEVAHQSFFKGLPFVQRATSGATGVSVDPDTDELVLLINPHTPLVKELLSSVGNWKDAWLLILAHESGHLRLNSICQAQGSDHEDPDMQLKAMGMDPAAYGGSPIADFQKETAVESFCDACAGLAAKELLGAQWREGVEALRDHRSRISKSLGLWAGDEYATSPALEALLERNGKIEPAEAARIAFEASLRQTSALKKSAVAIAAGIPELKQSIGDHLKRWRKACQKDRPGSPPPPPSAL